MTVRKSSLHRQAYELQEEGGCILEHDNIDSYCPLLA